jgi:multisubunit Na+/H+ antiporter MnhF subunit
MTPADFLVICLAVGVLSGARLVLRGSPENSIIGLNIAVVCAVTALVLLEVSYGVGFSTAIAFCLILPGVFGSILYAKFLRGEMFK